MNNQNEISKPVVVTVASPKGGPGKTTTLTSLSLFLSLRGKKVLCIDLDNIGSLSNNLQGPSNRSSKHSTVMSLFENSDSKIYPCEISENLFLIQGDERVSDINRVSSMETISNMDSAISERIDKINSFDYILIDTPAGDGNTVAASLIFADFVYSAITLDHNSLTALSSLTKILKPIRKRMNPELKHIGFVINQVHGIIENKKERIPETLSERKIYNGLKDKNNNEFFLGMIGFRNVIQKKIGEGEWVTKNTPSEKLADYELTDFCNKVFEAIQ